MIELAFVLLPFLAVDVLNPVLFAIMVVAVGTARPILNSCALLAGHTVAYFFSGVVIAFGLERIMERLANPEPIDFAIELGVGLMLLWAALSSRDGRASKPRTPEFSLTPLNSFGYGAIVNFIGVPFALPFFGAVDQVLKANLSLTATLAVVGVYCIAYALPFLIVPILATVMGEDSQAILSAMNDRLANLADMLMPVMLLLLGLALVADGLTYIFTGTPLWVV